MLGASCVLASLATLGATARAAVTTSLHGFSQDTCGVKIDGVMNMGIHAVPVTDHISSSGTTSDASIVFTPSTNSPQLLAWVNEALGGHNSVRNIQVPTLDSAYKDTTIETINKVSIVEVDFPVLSASTSNAFAYLTVKLTPNAASSSVAGSHTVQGAPTSIADKALLANWFKLEIDGLDLRFAKSVNAFAVTTPMNVPTAEARRAETAPNMIVTKALTSSVSAQNVVFSVAMNPAQYQPIAAWVSSGGAAKAGSIQYLSPVGTTTTVNTICVLSFASMTPVRINANNATQIADVEVRVSGLKLTCPGI